MGNYPFRISPRCQSEGEAAAPAAGSHLGAIGAQRAVCEHAVRRYDLELELQLERATDVPGMDKVQIHTRRFAAWEFERMKSQPDLSLRPDDADAASRSTEG